MVIRVSNIKFYQFILSFNLILFYNPIYSDTSVVLGIPIYSGE